MSTILLPRNRSILLRISDRFNFSSRFVSDTFIKCWASCIACLGFLGSIYIWNRILIKKLMKNNKNEKVQQKFVSLNMYKSMLNKFNKCAPENGRFRFITRSSVLSAFPFLFLSIRCLNSFRLSSLPPTASRLSSFKSRPIPSEGKSENSSSVNCSSPSRSKMEKR